VDPSGHSYARWKDPKSLAQVWTCSRHRLVESPQVDVVQVWQD
jgi:hypothetical protein